MPEARIPLDHWRVLQAVVDHGTFEAAVSKRQTETQRFVDHELDVRVDPRRVSLAIATNRSEIHPGESAGFYRDLLDRLGPLDVQRIDIAVGDLYEYLLHGDLVVTINSNVGLEAMMLGTTCVVVNRWEPLCPTHPYAEYGDVPILRCREAVDDFFADLTPGQIETLAQDQLAFVMANYRLESNAGSEIATSLCNPG